ncbi:hypothetical protein AUQ37_01525 [Candidatus Methanomethylophilus sp. 1R26]|nr:hypothetical protein AUQ37_01525 [Candidatus Methanomethylophilus sp. 1R26]
MPVPESDDASPGDYQRIIGSLPADEGIQAPGGRVDVGITESLIAEQERIVGAGCQASPEGPGGRLGPHGHCGDGVPFLFQTFRRGEGG